MSKRKRQTKKATKRKSSQRTWYIIGAIVVVMLTSIFTWQLIDRAKASERTISVNDAFQKYQQGVFFLDVRTQAEWAEYHIPNTTLIPLDELPYKVNEVPKNREIIVVCRTGNRSQEGRDILLKAGYDNVSSMNGGVNDWRTAGYPIE